MSTADLDDERAVLEVVEFSESEDEDFDYRAVEVRGKSSPFNVAPRSCLIDRKEPKLDECSEQKWRLFLIRHQHALLWVATSYLKWEQGVPDKQLKCCLGP